MKNFLSLILIFCFIFCCDAIEGPTGPEGEKGEKGNTGPQGEQGESGKDCEFTVILGYLDPGEPEYWIFETGYSLERCIISVWVSFDYGAYAAWFEPTWIFVSDTISIYNDEKADSGNRYRIIIVTKKDN